MQKGRAPISGVPLAGERGAARHQLPGRGILSPLGSVLMVDTGTRYSAYFIHVNSIFH